MIEIDNLLFENALALGLINQDQNELIQEYIKNPSKSMRNFLIENPQFLEDSLQGDEKTKERAKLCIEKNLYNQNSGKM